MRNAGGVQFPELASQMRPTRRELQRAAGATSFGEPVLGAPSVDLEQPGVAGEMALDTFTIAAVLEAVGHHGRRRPLHDLVE
jgi:hypothetical protein